MTVASLRQGIPTTRLQATSPTYCFGSASTPFRDARLEPDLCTGEDTYKDTREGTREGGQTVSLYREQRGRSLFSKGNLLDEVVLRVGV
jgi:hypothetical protein